MNASTGVRDALREAIILQGDMLKSLADADLDRLGELDMRCRALFAEMDTSRLGGEEASLLAEGLQGFLDFHRELQRACEDQRDAVAVELKGMRDSQDGAQAYRNTEKYNDK